MWEFIIIHKYSDIQEIVFGYDFYDACKRANLDSEKWKVLRSDYID